jgi:hypothetical protein
MEAFRMRAQTCMHHADVSSPKKQMVIERLRRRIENYTTRQDKLLSHTAAVDPIAMDQNLAETRLLHQRYLEAKAKKAGKKTDAKKGEGKDEVKEEDAGSEKNEPLSRVKEEPVLKREQQSPAPSTSSYGSQIAPPNQDLRPPSNPTPYDVGSVKEEPPSNPGSIIAEDIGSLVGDQVHLSYVTFE